VRAAQGLFRPIADAFRICRWRRTARYSSSVRGRRCYAFSGTARTSVNSARDASRARPRAVGGACRANHIRSSIPCPPGGCGQRARGFHGRVTRGRAMDIKRWLLEHEAAVMTNYSIVPRALWLEAA